MSFNNSKHHKKPVAICRATLFLLLFFSQAFFLHSSSVKAKQLTFHVGYEINPQPPYYLGENKVLNEKPGIAVEMILMLEEKIPELKIELRRYPWTRCTQFLADGRLDAIFNASFNEERMKIGYYPWNNHSVDIEKRITTISYALYVRKGSSITWDGSMIHSLTKAKVAAPRGYSIVGDLRTKGIQVEEVNSSEQIMKMLLNGRVAAGAMQQVTADKILDRDSELAQNVKRIEPTLVEKPYYLLISKQFYESNPELSQKIWDAIKEIRTEYFYGISKEYFD